MDKEDLNPEEEVETKPAEEGESEDQVSESADKDDEIAELKKTVANLEKGVSKFFSEQGREKKEETKVETKPQDDDLVEEVLLTKYPEAENVMEDLRETAKEKGVSVLNLYRNSKYYQGEAKAIADSKKVEEESKSKISKPSSGSNASKKDLSRISQDSKEFANLNPSEKADWFDAQVEKEKSTKRGY